MLSFLSLSFESTVEVPIIPDLFITLGSPLGSNQAHEGDHYLEENLVYDYVLYWLVQPDFSNCIDCYPRVRKWVNYWVWGDAISGPLKINLPGAVVEDVQMGDMGTSHETRNAITTGVWHKYDSLQPGGTKDNQDLKDRVKTEIINTLNE